MEGIRVEELDRFVDERGSLLKVLPRPVPGEVYLVRVSAGHSRGHHIHRQMGEWFVALEGDGLVGLADPVNGEFRHIALAGVRVYVPQGVAHALFNTGDGELVVLALADGGHDPMDVHPYLVPEPT